MLVRALNDRDLNSLLDLYAQLHASDDPLPDHSRVLQVWASMLENSMLHPLGLEFDGQLVASCTLTITPNLTRGARPWGQIETVITHRDYRRRGLGQSLIRAALGIAWEHDCYKVMLMTGRADVHHFYESCGFRKDVKTGFVAYPAT